MNTILRVICCAWGLTGALSAPAASFDCQRAATAVERQVCGDAALSGADERLARAYGAALQGLGTAATCLQADQREWLRQRRNACADAPCLTRVYAERLAELDPLLPGVMSAKDEPPPGVSALMGFIAPAADTVAAPPLRRSQPVVAQGVLRVEVEKGDGFVLLDDKGRRHLLLPLMFIEAHSDALLRALAGTPGLRLQAQGKADPAQPGLFSPAACIALRRLP